MEDLEIRRGLLTDAAALANFAARTFAESYAADNRPEDVQAHIASSFGVAQQTRELTDPTVTTLLVHRHGALLAYAQVRRSQPPACVTHELAMELHRFYVDRPAHGTGVARKLMNAVHLAARELDGKHLWLSVWERNPRALAFYAKTGFVPVGKTVFQVGDDAQTDHVLVAVVQ